MWEARGAMVAAVPAAAMVAAAPVTEAKMRETRASWYGPGLWGNLLGCGGWLSRGTFGVAHKTLPCGTRLRLCAGRCVTVRVIDRGPFEPGREFDLTQAVAQRVKLRVDRSGSGVVHVRRMR
jgi:rare lipoprotein A